MKAKERKLARKLRQEGKSIREITKKIECSKSSISRWVRDISLTNAQIQQLRNNQDKSREKAARHPNSPKLKWEKIRNEFAKNASKEILPNYSKDILKLIGAALYWSEGYTAGRNVICFSNSDAIMTKLMMKFFRKICKIPEKKFRGGINIHPHLNARKAKIFWSKISGIPLHQFHKTQTAISRASKGKRDTLPLGTFKIIVCDTRLLSKIKGWIKGLEKWASSSAG